MCACVFVFVPVCVRVCVWMCVCVCMCVCHEGGDKLHIEKLHSLYPSANIVSVLKSTRLRWAGYVARMEEANIREPSSALSDCVLCKNTHCQRYFDDLSPSSFRLFWTAW